jgi:hypothetical protein
MEIGWRRLFSDCVVIIEPQEELAFNEVLKHIGPHANMIEIGGFWSYYSLWFYDKIRLYVELSL